MKHVLKDASGATVFGEGGEVVRFTKVGDNAMGSDGSMVISTPGSNSFLVTSPGGSTELFTGTSLGTTAFGSNGTQITNLGPSSGIVFKP